MGKYAFPSPAPAASEVGDQSDPQDRKAISSQSPGTRRGGALTKLSSASDVDQT